jgi:hypothetical protein
VVDLPVVTKAVLEAVNMLVFKLWRQRKPLAATEKRGPVSTVVVVDRKGLPAERNCNGRERYQQTLAAIYSFTWNVPTKEPRLPL